MISRRTLVTAAYRLQSSKRYRTFKRFFDNFLNNAHYPLKRYFDMAMMALIFSSVLILIRDVKHESIDALNFFNQYVISIIFLIEYLLRLWVSSESSAILINHYEKDDRMQRPFRFFHAIFDILAAKWRFIRSPAALIDLLAIMPFFHEIRLLRLFVFFRAFKLFRYTQNIHHFAQVIFSKKSELLTLFTFAGIVIFISAVLIYVMEALNPDSKVDTLFEAIYWSVVTISTVGYGDVTPITLGGQIVALVVILAGVVVLSFSTSIVISAFTEKLEQIRQEKQIHDASRLKTFYLICGYGAVAKQTADKLRKMGIDLVIIDADAQKVEEAHKRHHLALELDPASIESYAHIRMDLQKQVKAVLLLGERDIDNIVTALTIRSMQREVRIVSILHDKGNRRKLAIAGVNDIIYAQELVGELLREYSDHPVAFEALHALRSEHTGVLMDEILIDERMNVEKISDLQIKGRHLILLGVKPLAAPFVFNPSEDMTLSKGDKLVVIAEKPIVHEYRNAWYP